MNTLIDKIDSLQDIMKTNYDITHGMINKKSKDLREELNKYEKKLLKKHFGTENIVVKLKKHEEERKLEK